MYAIQDKSISFLPKKITQYPPKTFFLQGIFQAIEVVLQNTRIQTRGPNAGGGGIFTILHSGHSHPSIFPFFLLYLLINQIYVPHTNVV